MKPLWKQLGFAVSDSTPRFGPSRQMFLRGESFSYDIETYLNSANDSLELKQRVHFTLAILHALREITVDYAEELEHMHMFRELKKARNATRHN